MGHNHSHTHGANESSVGFAALLTGLFMIAEIAGGLISGSLALLADAGHMLVDFASLALAWFGFRLARRPADWQKTYGYDRFSVLIAFTNGLALFAIAGWIVFEAYDRFSEPREILGNVMLAVAAAGLFVNIAAFWVLHRADQSNLNIRVASLHVLGDLLGSVAAIAAAIIILLTGWTPIDPILSVLVALIILRSAWRVIGESAHILLEGVPPSIDIEAIKADLPRAVGGVTSVHHVHAWLITQERPMITLHAVVDSPLEHSAIVAALKVRLARQFGIAHATIEIETDKCADDLIEGAVAQSGDPDHRHQ